MKKFKQFKSSVQESDFLPFKKTGPNSKIDDYLIIGFDTEYVSKSIDDNDFENELLSYQWCCQVISSDGTKSDEWSGLVLPNGPKVSDRLFIQEFVELAISEGLKKNKELKIPRDIFLVAHFTRSDIPGFQDFKGEEGKKILNLSNIRNTFVSMRKDVDIKLNDDIEVRLKIRDTITLTSANSKSLDDLGKMLEVPKLKLSKEQISNMKVVLEEEPELFDDRMEQDIHNMLEEAIECEVQFAEDLLSGGVVGMNSQDMRTYLEFITDQRLIMLGMEPKYFSQNPFPFMELQDVQELANFFERRVSAYQTGVSGEVSLFAEF